MANDAAKRGTDGRFSTPTSRAKVELTKISGIHPDQALKQGKIVSSSRHILDQRILKSELTRIWWCWWRATNFNGEGVGVACARAAPRVIC